MPEIKEIQHVENHKSYLIVHALTDEGDEVSIFVGGQIEIYYHKGKIKAYVKRNKSLTDS